MNRNASLVVALDFPSVSEALALTRTLEGLPLWLKVGLELFTIGGPDVALFLRGAGFPVFLDLKFHDIPNTVQSAVRSATALGVNMATLHLEGGEAMVRAAVEGRREALEQASPLGEKPNPGPLLMGITVLTSAMEKGDGDIRELVVQRAIQGKKWGLDGVVCSGWEAAAVKEACGGDFLCLCPGIRFSGGDVGDQARVSTPGQAVTAGADFLVMGRPITRDKTPRNAAERALAEIAAAE